MKSDFAINSTFSKFYAPSVFWISALPPVNIAKIIVKSVSDIKSPYINSVIRLVVLLGEEGMAWLNAKLEDLYRKVIQKPDFYYSFHIVYKKRTTLDLKLRALRITGTKQIQLPIAGKTVSANYLMQNKLECANELSKVCMSVFEGKKENRTIARSLDLLAYGDIIIEQGSEILAHINELTT